MSQEKEPSGPSLPNQEVKKEPSTYEVKINKDKIDALEGVPNEMKEWLKRLPETLRFDDQVTLIVGENGSGKTVISKAILNARANSFKNNNPEAYTSSFFLDKEDPAMVLSEILEVDETRSTPTFVSVFLDGAQVMAEVRQWANLESQKNAGERVESVSGGTYTHRRSTRQLFEDAIQTLKQNAIDRNRRRSPIIDIIFDEPEQGLSPMRQLNLQKMVTEFIDEGDTVLVPTNNLALYLSDIPRLDIEQPERGVYKPSDFGEEGKIELHK